MRCSLKISLILLASTFAQEIETEEIEEKKEKSEFITTNCQKTNVEIFIPKWTVSNGPPASVTLLSALGNNCRGAYHNKTHITLNINLLDPKRDCGTTRRSQGVQIIYENKLSFTDQKSRKIEDLANITCIQYLQEKHVRLPSSAAINNLQAGPVSIKTQMKLFNTAKFEEELEDLAEKGYAQVAVREFIYVRVAFDFAENEAAMETDKVVIDSCWGSRSANPDNMKTAYMMIENGCSADPLGVIIRQNSAGAYASWKFQMYKWTTVAQHEQFIYIHCRAWICTDCQKPEANHACLGDITKFRRRRAAKLFQNREVSSERARIFSVGPIYPRDGSVPLLSDVESDDPAVKGEIPGMPGMGDEEEEDNFIMAVIVGSVSGFCALFLLIVAIVFVKKYREKPFQIFTKPAEEEEDEKNIEQGFVFELRTSTDPVIPRVNLDQFLGRDDEPREQRERKTERRIVEEIEIDQDLANARPAMARAKSSTVAVEICENHVTISAAQSLTFEIVVLDLAMIFRRAECASLDLGCRSMTDCLHLMRED
ncbi:Oidioi.mRNA.OKI2018_I69.chr2.g4052.t1.cds [Oikopleura dioica]|uniref:Oidioi.mRNA.OKI2018_I69.chr2.g4052.t1.cds n=1 Tax=Oikopleura dioica TaxID=34765 RepID=A0ABN7T578_OIKDI|nr:Oidioi.mRNA.OKI2018_I69.chr2.g4052.t1.cds [Oikopleura dioica]